MHRPLEDFKIQALSIRKRKRKRMAKRFALSALVLFAGFAGWVNRGVVAEFLALNGDSANNEIALSSGGQKFPDKEFELSEADKPRDPVFFRRGGAKRTKATKFEIRFQNVSTAATGTENVFYVSDRMLAPSVRLMTALPALPQDFALMGSSSVEEKIPTGDPSVNVASNTLQVDESSTEDGWETIDGQPGDQKPEVDEGEPAAGKGGSSTFSVMPSGKRLEVSREFVVKAIFKRSLAGLLQERFDDKLAVEEAAQSAAALLNIRDLQAGYVVAFRVDNMNFDLPTRKIVQLSIFDQRGLIGSIGMGGDQAYSAIQDPWKDDGLTMYSQDSAEGLSQKRFRIMDGIYSAGARNDVPPHILNETIMQMARHYDLSQFIESSDRLSLIYSAEARDPSRSDGHVLYASVKHAGENLACYILKPNSEKGFTCMTEKDTVVEKLGPSGFSTPVNGALRSRFGPRLHPIHKTVRLHKGVDWAAPTGTPIKAAFDGRVDFAGRRGGYGNFVKLVHTGAMATSYAHMSQFAKKTRKGASVKAGEVIGYVGSTGLSTGPHLHFELAINGKAVDPLGYNFDPEPLVGSTEKDKLVQQIIKVESGGRANAKNPLSSATGLGQFIDSTWIRMMRAYRPDIASSMGRGQLLSLRYDPSLAREMVYNLASESEADIRRAGHRATAGNLYLAHFLGSIGAVTVLNAPSDKPLINVVGAGVIRANPFLRGKSTRWVVNWAARKMSGRNARVYASRPRLPKGARIKNSRFQNYSSAIDQMLASIEKEVGKASATQ